MTIGSDQFIEVGCVVHRDVHIEEFRGVEVVAGSKVCFLTLKIVGFCIFRWFDIENFRRVEEEGESFGSLPSSFI